ncbi:MAG: hypothetical protein J6C46_08905 [Clostridia bacterium]|nr:hypothetical protein [Clostridia bacterium]
MKNNIITENIDKVLRGVIITLGLVLGFMLFAILYTFFNEVEYTYNDKDDFYYALKNGRYDSFFEYYAENISSGLAEEEELQEYYAVAKYYQTAILYKAYYMYGENETAEEFYEEMQELEKEMGALKEFKKDILNKLEIDLE